ncbi:hypothetical protein Scep_008838 [Stephania cephalantha]|uniref:Phospholipid/glycerol acyltransferase domain-containing protein n=1 Tax=Stephania cephalantha TaxID=152367 RepID=A0AAP0JUF2_9MAGN
MDTRMLPFKALLLFSRFLLRRLRNTRALYRKLNVAHTSHQFKPRKCASSVPHSTDFSHSTLIFDIDGALLKSSSLFPYFFLVAFEAGGFIRALILMLLYPLVFFVSEETGLKIMVMVCFIGIKKESFRVGRAVMPNAFLRDVKDEGFEILMKGGRKVAVSAMPSVMVEGFLRDYMKVDAVLGRDLKEFNGYYVGLMEDKAMKNDLLEQLMKNMKAEESMVAIKTSEKRLNDHMLFSLCKEIYMVSEPEKKSWKALPRHKYPKPLIFHDGRLANIGNTLDILAIFLWIPLGFTLAIIRAASFLLLPSKISTPILAFTGIRLTVKKNDVDGNKSRTKGLLYVCNHRTLLDPLFLSTALNRHITALTYSLSRVAELLSPIRTVRLTRCRDRDSKLMEEILSQGDVVVCPEGTTCREPYLLRFSPLFAEMKAQVVPVAINSQVSMFHGTTAAGLKCLDPLFFLMNPCPCYKIQVLEHISREISSLSESKSSVEVANYVQSELGKALGFQCTKLTRKDKYLILAGNEGAVN